MKEQHPSPTVEWVEVTPKLAEQWLNANTHNRNLSERHVKKLARDMDAGRWKTTGDAIRFDRDMNLQDGQHRLWAVMESGSPQTFLVIRGLDPTAQEAMDRGRTRSAGDTLTLRGYPDATTIAAVARVALSIKVTGTVSRQSFSDIEITDFIDNNPDILEATRMCRHLHSTIDLPPSVLGYGWWAFNRISPSHCEAFFTALSTSATSGKGDPRAALLHRLATSRRAGSPMRQVVQISLLVRTWNAWRQEKSVHSIPMERNGEIIPIPRPI